MSMVEDWNLEQFEEASKSPVTAAFYLYTPLCGTCQVASKMIGVVEKLLPEVRLGKADLNYHEEVAVKYGVESVPCLLVTKEGRPVEKIYAFRSVPYLFEILS